MEYLQWFLIFMVATWAANMLLRFVFKKSYYLHKFYIDKGYEQGYRDGCTNIRMFHGMRGTFPSPEWLVYNKGKLIDTREKFIDSMNN